METIRHYFMLIGGDRVGSDDRLEKRLIERAQAIGRLDRRACALLLSAPPA